MRRKRLAAALASVLWFAVAPGVFAGLVPWGLTGWEARHGGLAWLPARIAGAALIVIGTTVLVHAFARFVIDGLGTPAPIAPPRRLVVAGPYRYVRNPMHVATVAAIVGQALLLVRYELLVYATILGIVVAAVTHLYEEPELTRRFGDDYRAYRSAVHSWWPRRHPWSPKE